MKKSNKIIALMLASTMLFAGCNNNEKAVNTNTNEKAATESNGKDKKASKLPDNLVAKVDGEDILKDDYKKELDFYSSMIASQQQLMPTIVNMMVQDKLILKDMEKNGIKVTDQEISDAFMNAVNNMGGEKKFDELLDNYNMDSEMFKETVKKDLMYTKHKEWFMENNAVTDEDIEKYYEEHKDEFEKRDAAHILVEDKETAEEIKQRLDDGENWDDLAKEFSKDTQNAQNGGQLGEFSKGQMVKEFEDAAFALNEGDISEPVETNFGWHIIKMNKVLDSASDSKEQISELLKTEKYNEYIKKLNDEADIETMFDTEEDAVEEGKEETTETIIETEEETDGDEKQEDSKEQKDNN